MRAALGQFPLESFLMAATVALGLRGSLCPEPSRRAPSSIELPGRFSHPQQCSLLGQLALSWTSLPLRATLPLPFLLTLHLFPHCLLHRRIQHLLYPPLLINPHSPTSPVRHQCLRPHLHPSSHSTVLLTIPFTITALQLPPNHPLLSHSPCQKGRHAACKSRPESLRRARQEGQTESQCSLLKKSQLWLQTRSCFLWLKVSTVEKRKTNLSPNLQQRRS